MEWIPVKERLPDFYQQVIVHGGIGYLNRDGVWYTITAIDYPGKPIQWEVTHWIPLPEPPKL